MGYVNEKGTGKKVGQKPGWVRTFENLNSLGRVFVLYMPHRV